jgi:spore maturation protein CgeB
MRVLIIDPYYSAFLDSFYAGHPNLAERPYDEQWRVLMDQGFGTADFYSSNLIALGHEATEIVANSEVLQRQWAREHGLDLSRPKLIWRKRAGLIPWPQRTPPPPWFETVLLAQVKHYRPDVLHLQDMNGTSVEFLREVRPYVKLITGQIACPLSPGADFREYDLVLSSFPHFVDQFRGDGLRSEYFNLGFESTLLTRLKKGPAHSVVFIGGLSLDHAERIEFLEHLAASRTVDIWGYGLDSLGANSALRRLHHGPLWALDMYQVLHDSSIALNHHINVAEASANNMRLYEATGVGAFLLTDHKENLKTLFEPGKEVVTYRSAGEAAELIDYYLTHDTERQAIAKAGQARTLREHTYLNRMHEFVGIVNRYLP